MAANDYFSSFNSSKPGYGRREDALPPVPSQAPSHGRDSHNDGSPVTSPFTDDAYPAYPGTSSRPTKPGYETNPYESTTSSFQEDTAYASHDRYGHGDRRNQHGTDPFADQNAIPLKNTNASTTAYGAYDADSNSPTAGNGEAERQPWGERDQHGRQKDFADHGLPKPWYKRRIAWACWTLTVIQVIVFIAELARNGVLTGSPIETSPQFNPMIGPSPYVLINMGGRFVPCMRNVHQVTDSPVPIFFPCPNATTFDTECTLSELCGFSGVPNPVPGGTMNSKPEPNQWYRFIIPIFLHAGLIHIAFNLLLQLTLGREVEMKIGTLRFLLVYMSAGIFGFVFGGNYAAIGIASCGASGSLFGILALTLLDLLYHWRQRRNPVRELCFIMLDVVIAFVLGLLPGLDNFSHIGGFLMGLVLGICILRSPAALRERIGQDEPPYGPVGGAGGDGMAAFTRAPVGFFKGRKPLWWVWWLIRVGALVGVLVGFIVLLKNFYVDRVTCGWCKYLSCLPINHWCDLGNLQITETNGTSSKRDLFGLQVEAMQLAGAF